MFNMAYSNQSVQNVLTPIDVGGFNVSGACMITTNMHTFSVGQEVLAEVEYAPGKNAIEPLVVDTMSISRRGYRGHHGNCFGEMEGNLLEKASLVSALNTGEVAPNLSTVDTEGVWHNARDFVYAYTHDSKLKVLAKNSLNPLYRRFLHDGEEYSSVTGTLSLTVNLPKNYQPTVFRDKLFAGHREIVTTPPSNKLIIKSADFMNVNFDKASADNSLLDFESHSELDMTSLDPSATATTAKLSNPVFIPLSSYILVHDADLSGTADLTLYKLGYAPDKVSPSSVMVELTNSSGTVLKFTEHNAASFKNRQVYTLSDDNFIYRLSFGATSLSVESLALDINGDIAVEKAIRVVKINTVLTEPVVFLIDNWLYVRSANSVKGVNIALSRSEGAGRYSITNSHPYGTMLITGNKIITDLQTMKGVEISGHFDYVGSISDLLVKNEIKFKRALHGTFLTGAMLKKMVVYLEK